MTSPGPNTQAARPLPKDVDSLAAELDAHQTRLVNAVGALRGVADPTVMKQSAAQDAHTVRAVAATQAHQAVHTPEGDVNTQRLALAGLAAVGAIVLLVTMRRRRARKRTPQYRRELVKRLQQHVDELTDSL